MAIEPSPARLSIYDAAAANRWRTIALIAAFTALIVVLGYFVGEYFAPGGGPAVLPFAFALSIGGALASYFAGDPTRSSSCTTSSRRSRSAWASPRRGST